VTLAKELMETFLYSVVKFGFVMVNFAVSVKSFIVDDEGRLLIIQRAGDDVQKPGIWEVPGGRLVPGEDPFAGLVRETKEETGLDVKVVKPLSVRHFTRVDGQVITMLIFLCKPLNKVVMLSGEHSDFDWVSADKASGMVSEFYDDELRLFRNGFK